MTEHERRIQLSQRVYNAISAINDVVMTPGATDEAIHAELLRVQLHLDARLAQTATPSVPPTGDLPYDPADRLKGGA